MRAALARVGASMGILGVLVLSILPPVLAADPDPVESAVTVEQIAAQLERDPVFVQQLAGGGDVEATRQVVRRTIDQLPYPVFVVAGRLPVGRISEDASTLAFSLRRILGKDAVYAVAPLHGVPAVVPMGAGMPERPRNHDDARRVAEEMLRQFPDDFDEPEGDEMPISQVRETAVADVLVDLHGLDGGTMTDEQVRDLASHRFLHVVTRDPDESGSPSAGRRWMVGSTVGLLVLFWSPRVIRRFADGPSPRPSVSRDRGQKQDPKQDHGQRPTDWTVPATRLEMRRSQLARELSRLEPATLRHRELYEAALLASEAADTCAESDSERDRLGALTLVEQGLQAARHANDRKDPPTRWRPCFLNPLHGRAGGVRQWVFDDAEVRVPLCRDCARRLDRGQAPEPLFVRSGLRTVPYFEVADVWGRTGYGSLIDDYPQAVLRARAEGDR